jgi:hypothetical protein
VKEGLLRHVAMPNGPRSLVLELADRAVLITPGRAALADPSDAFFGALGAAN